MGGVPETGGGGAGHDGPARAGTPVSGQSTIIASELGGSLPCLRCKYNLKGLSIRSVCPECGLPVRATLLAVVDPMATELRPIPRPLLTATGVVVWSSAALGAAALIWARLLAQGTSGPVDHALGVGIVALTVLSGLGALPLIKPHEGMRTGARRAALIAALAYIPLVMVMWWLHVDMGPQALGGDSWREVDPARSELRVLAGGLIMVIVVGLRPNARVLAARSLLMRTGRVDRQTMLALVGVLGVGMAGDALALAGGLFSGPLSQSLHLIAQLLVLVASVLFTIGLVGVVVDCWRMRPVILESPRTLEGILSQEDEPSAARTPTIPHAP